jgi:hypothetical protein
MSFSTPTLQITTLFQHTLSDLLKLQADVLENLSPEQKPFVYERNAQKYEAHIAKQEILGGFIDNQLIACLINQTPEDLDDVGHILAPEELLKSRVVGGLLVHPKHQHHHYGRQLIAKTQSIYQNQPLVAEILPHNYASWKSFLKLGFSVVAANFSPIDGVPVMWLQNKACINKSYIGEIDPAIDFTALCDYLTQGSGMVYQGNQLKFYS